MTYDSVPLLLPGGTVPFAFLPGGFRQVAPWLPNGAIVSAARDVVYLPGTAHLRRRLARQPAAALETASTSPTTYPGPANSSRRARSEGAREFGKHGIVPDVQRGEFQSFGECGRGD